MSNGNGTQLRLFVDLTEERAKATAAQFERDGFTVTKEKQDSGKWAVAACKCS